MGMKKKIRKENKETGLTVSDEGRRVKLLNFNALQFAGCCHTGSVSVTLITKTSLLWHVDDVDKKNQLR